MIDKETFIKRETEVEERKILDWCGTIFKSMVGGAIALVPLTMFYCICIRNFGSEPAIICMSLVLLLLVLAIVLAYVFEFSNKIAYRRACKSWEKEHKIQEKRQKDEDRAIQDIKVLMAVDIIQKKQVDFHNFLISETVEQYNSYTHKLGFKGNLTEEEFNLVKEVLL